MDPTDTWEITAIAAVRATREHDPQDWQTYLDDAKQMARADAEICDGWHDRGHGDPR